MSETELVKMKYRELKEGTVVTYVCANEGCLLKLSIPCKIEMDVGMLPPVRCLITCIMQSEWRLDRGQKLNIYLNCNIKDNQ